MKMLKQNKLGRKLLNLLLTLTMVIGLMPIMSHTAKADGYLIPLNIAPEAKTYYEDSLLVSIDCLESGVTIYYTTDGSDPTTSSTRTEYKNTILLESTTTIKAIAMQGGEPVSSVESATYTLKSKEKETTPTATFTATGADTGKLSSVANGMKYSLNGGTSWTNITSNADINLTGLSAGTIQVVKKGDGTATLDSDPQTITVTKAEKPNLTVTQPTVIDGKGTVATTTAHEYSSDNGSTWTTCTANQEFAVGNYLIRVKANGTVLASENQSVEIKAFISATVTFKVENGSWNEGEGDAATADKTVTLTGHEGDELKLTENQIPSAGSKPSTGYKAGSWDTTPSTTTAITEDTTYTYTYAAKQASEVTKAPEAKTLTYTGSAQELVSAGSATGGTLNYALGTDSTTAPTSGWSESIPEGTEAGIYYVWYKVVGDADHLDTDPQSLKVIIKGYDTISGEGQKWIKGSSEGAEFIFKDAIEDNTYEQFISGGKIYIGESATPLDSTHYTATEGSLIITLNSSYLETLSAGRYTLKVAFVDNGEVSTYFFVENKATPSGGDSSETHKLPKTGVE